MKNSNQIVTEASFPLSLNLYKLEHLCLQLGVADKTLLEIHSKRNNLINCFELKTGKSNKIRPISSPYSNYKKVLRRLNKLLQKRSTFNQGVCGGIQEKRIIDMVKKHCAKEAYYSTDIKNFFPSINYKRIIYIFLKAGCSRDIAELLADLVSYNDALPQGFPTSPIISNIVASKLDFDQVNISKKYNLYRTRWIDDIVFSGRITDLETSIHKINSSIVKNNFTRNNEKSHFNRRKDDPQILGLSVKKHKPYVPKLLIDKIELIFASIIKYGFQQTYELFQEDFKSKKSKDPKSIILNSTLGKILYVKDFNKSDADLLMSKYNFIVKTI